MIRIMLHMASIVIVLTEIVLAPSNTAVVIGDEMKMSCVVMNNSRVRKWDIFTTNLEAFTIYSGGKFHKRFDNFLVNVDDKGSGILYTNSTNLSDAGIYKCLSVIDGQYKEHSAQLTVLELMPTCEEVSTLKSLNSSKSLLDGDRIWMQCNVNFRGFWTPTMEWIEYGAELGPEGRTVTEGVEQKRIQNASVTSNLTFVVNSSTDGSRFACKLYFAKYDGIHNMTATNVPNFTYTWNSSLITLSYSSSQFDSTTLQEVESSTAIRTARQELERQTSTDWYFISLSLVAALSVFLIIIVVLVVAFCIRFKNKLSAKYASAALTNLEMSTNDGNYDILPYATSDNYDTIDDMVVNDDFKFKVSFAPRQGPLPTPGYSGLTQMQTTAPGVYTRIDTYETPVDIPPLSIDAKIISTLENTSEKQADDSDEKRNGEGKGNQSTVQPYLELVDCANPGAINKKHVNNNREQIINGKREMALQQEENHPSVHPHCDLLDVVEADKTLKCTRASDSDIPSSYLTVAF